MPMRISTLNSLHRNIAGTEKAVKDFMNAQSTDEEEVDTGNESEEVEDTETSAVILEKPPPSRKRPRPKPKPDQAKLCET